MATLDDEIALLKVEIEGYKNELIIAFSETRKDLLYGLIKSSRDNLTELLKQKNSQTGISFSLFKFQPQSYFSII